MGSPGRGGTNGGRRVADTVGKLGLKRKLCLKEKVSALESALAQKGGGGWATAANVLFATNVYQQDELRGAKKGIRSFAAFTGAPAAGARKSLPTG